MIALGFALRGTLTASLPLEREAFIELLRERWASQGEPFRAGDALPLVCEEYTRLLLSLRHVMRTALEWREGHYIPPFERW